MCKFSTLKKILFSVFTIIYLVGGRVDAVTITDPSSLFTADVSSVGLVENIENFFGFIYRKISDLFTKDDVPTTSYTYINNSTLPVVDPVAPSVVRVVTNTSTQAPAVNTVVVRTSTVAPSDASLLVILRRLLSQPEFTSFLQGPVGAQGERGETGNTAMYPTQLVLSTQSPNSPAPIPSVFMPVGISQPNPLVNFSGATYFNATDLSSRYFKTSEATIGTLNVTGDTTMGGNLTVIGNITGNVVGTINPSFTPGSIPFQGTTGLEEDNANFFWDDTNSRLGVGTNAPTKTLDVKGDALFERSGALGVYDSVAVAIRNTNPSSLRSALYLQDWGLQSGYPNAETTNVFAIYNPNNYGLPFVIRPNSSIWLGNNSWDGTDTGDAALRVRAIAQTTLVNFMDNSQNSRFYVATSGNVGIGTATPSQKLDVSGNIALPTTVNSTTGVIYKGVDRFIHNFALAGTDGGNTFIGVNAGNFTMAGSSGNLGSNNTAQGAGVLFSNTTGYGNSAQGSSALSSNTSGYWNSAQGVSALTYNTIGYGNTAQGAGVLFSNTEGYNNSAQGFRAGYGAGGNEATTVDNNSTFLGALASRSSNVPTATPLSNLTVIGYDAKGLASNQVVLGNDSVTTTLLKGSVGIGTNTPSTFTLEVAGNIGPEADNTRDLGSVGQRFANIYANNFVGGITPSGFTQGSVVFAGVDGALSQNNTNFFWDNATSHLTATNPTLSTYINASGTPRGGTVVVIGGNEGLGEDGSVIIGNSATSLGGNNSYFNTIIGYGASSTANAPKNVLVGKGATTNQADNVVIGNGASSTGSGAIVIGSTSSTSAASSIVIGFGATTSTANAVAIGGTNSLFQMGGNFVPSARMHIQSLGTTSATYAMKVQNSSAGDILAIRDDGNVGIGTATPTALLQLAAGTASTAPLKLTSGTNLTVVEAGAFEYNGTDLFFSPSTTRNTILRNNTTTASVTDSVFVGFNTGLSASSATYANFIGRQAGYLATNASNSNFLGQSAGYQATSASNSNFFGNSAGNGASGAIHANFLGSSAGYNASSASYSNFFGSSSGHTAANATNSNFFGNSAGYQSTSASYSNFFGYYAGRNSPSATYSNFLGRQAGYGNSSSSYSNFFGFNTGAFFTGNDVGSNNIIIGTNISLPNAASSSINLGGVLFGTGTYATTTGSPSITPVSGGKIGIGVVSPSYTLQVGNNSVAGIVARFENSTGTCDINPTTTSLSCSSDINLKKNIVLVSDENTPFTITDNLGLTPQTVTGKISALVPVKYNWNNETSSDIRHVGFIAQQVESIFPDLVSTDPTTSLKSLNYIGLIPYTIASVQDLNIKIESINMLSETDNSFVGHLRNWFASVTNGIENLFAKKIRTEELCVKKSDGNEVCITGDQLQQLLGGSSDNSSAEQNSSSVSEGGNTEGELVGEENQEGSDPENPDIPQE